MLYLPKCNLVLPGYPSMYSWLTLLCSLQWLFQSSILLKLPLSCTFLISQGLMLCNWDSLTSSFASIPKHFLNLCLCFFFVPEVVDEAASILDGSNSHLIVTGREHPFASDLAFVTAKWSLQTHSSHGDNMLITKELANEDQTEEQDRLLGMTMIEHRYVAAHPMMVTKTTRGEWVVLVVWK